MPIGGLTELALCPSRCWALEPRSPNMVQRSSAEPYALTLGFDSWRLMVSTATRSLPASMPVG
jgi:hypothetical protein